MHVPYPGVHHPVRVPPMLSVNGAHIPNGGIHHYPGHSAYPPAHLHPMGHPSLPPNQLNGYHVAHFEGANVPSLHHSNAPFVATSTSAPIPYNNQAGAQPISKTTMSKDEFYLKQRSLQRG